MKKYLREIEMAGVVLLFVGIVIAMFVGSGYGAWPCGVGLLLLLTSYLYKAFHWAEYANENKENIIMILLTTFLLLFSMLARR